jgi:hypothetical protein
MAALFTDTLLGKARTFLSDSKNQRPWSPFLGARGAKSLEMTETNCYHVMLQRISL